MSPRAVFKLCRGQTITTEQRLIKNKIIKNKPRLSDPVPAPKVDGLVVHHEHDHPPRVVDQGPAPGHPRYCPDRLLSAYAAADDAAAPPADAVASRPNRVEESIVVSLHHLRREDSLGRERSQDSVLQGFERLAVLVRGVISADLGEMCVLFQKIWKRCVIEMSGRGRGGAGRRSSSCLAGGPTRILGVKVLIFPLG